MISARVRPLLPDLIHDTQTGFVQDRSILDNVFTFSEVTERAQYSGQHLAILLLDFEKAYDRVDWSFLEGTLERLGFPLGWIQGISALYRTASSRVIIGDRMGERFRLERSVRQGCPLAPYMFLFFAEAMTHYLQARTTGIRGVRLPIREDSELLDSEYADDTTLYVQDDEMTLERVRLALEVFCSAADAKINWNK